MLPVAEAKARIAARIHRIAPESVPLARARGRVLAADVVASRKLPPWDNSAMDGYAVRSQELPGELPVAGTIAAGDTPGRELQPGTALAIMTGAPVPIGADAVVMREDVARDGERARFPRPAHAGQHIRRAGEDIDAGECAVPAGSPLGAGELGLCAALGANELVCARPPVVAVLSTGNELVPAGEEPGPGQIVSSNAVALAAQIADAGGVCHDLGIARDARGELGAHLVRALSCDVLVTSGGVSVGEFDFVRAELESQGVEIEFWKVAIKPGKPLVFGATPPSADRPAGTLVFGLPGNPVSSMVSFELFVRPALLAMQGHRHPERPMARVELCAPIAKSPGRAHYVRARLERSGSRLRAHPLVQQGSGMLRSMVDVDALLELPAACGDVEAGDHVNAVLLRLA